MVDWSGGLIQGWPNYVTHVTSYFMVYQITFQENDKLVGSRVVLNMHW